MKPIPTTIEGRHARRMSALCDDLFDLARGHRGQSDTPRLDALLVTEKATKAGVQS